MRLVQDLDQGAAGVDAFDEVDAIEHRAGCPIPFGDDHDELIAVCLQRPRKTGTVPLVVVGNG